ncbi:MAG: ice-binding family protein [Blastococcus sp.]
MPSVPMPLSRTRPGAGAGSSRRLGSRAGTSLVAISSIGVFVALTGTAQAAATTVPLGRAGSFAVLAGSGISNTGTTTITGDIGTFPTTTITGAASIVQTGTNHAGDAVTQGAKHDLLSAYGTAAGEGPSVAVTADLGGRSLRAGVYKAASSMGLTGALTLDAAGNPDAVFVFKTGSTLTTASGSSVVLKNGAQACHVFWQVGSSATLGTATRFRGNILASSSITLTTGATVQGRVLASGGAVTLDTNVITVPGCTRRVTPPPVTQVRVDSVPTGTAPPTGPRGQVSRVPVGGVETGDGSTADWSGSHR